MAVQILVAGDIRVAQRFCKVDRYKDLSSVFWNGSAFLRSILTKKKAAARDSLPQLVSAIPETLLHF